MRNCISSCSTRKVGNPWSLTHCVTEECQASSVGILLCTALAALPPLTHSPHPSKVFIHNLNSFIFGTERPQNLSLMTSVGPLLNHRIRRLHRNQQGSTHLALFETQTLSILKSSVLQFNTRSSGQGILRCGGSSTELSPVRASPEVDAKAHTSIRTTSLAQHIMAIWGLMAKCVIVGHSSL